MRVLSVNIRTQIQNGFFWMVISMPTGLIRWTPSWTITRFLLSHPMKEFHWNLKWEWFSKLET
jgi:hypothetical protein